MWVAGNTVPSLIEGVETIRENGVQVLFVMYLEAHTLLIIVLCDLSILKRSLNHEFSRFR